MFQITVPTRVELVVPLKPLTRTVEAVGGLIKSERLLEMHEVAPPSTSMSKESESKIALGERRGEEATEAARAIPAVMADIASNREGVEAR